MKTIETIEHPIDRLFTVIYQWSNGSFGYDICREEPEEPRGLQPLGQHSGAYFETPGLACAAAYESVPWLKRHRCPHSGVGS